MKRILDYFDQAPLWIRLSTLAVLFLVLILSLIFVKNDQPEMVRTVPVSSSQSSSSSEASSEQAEVQAEEQAVAQAEQAVGQLEYSHAPEDLQAAQAAVDKVRDEVVRARLQGRIQAVSDLLGLSQQPESELAPVDNTVPLPVE